MAIQTHGLSIGIGRIDARFFLRVKAVGTLTHADYEVITPMIDAALAQVKDPEVYALFDASELDGWELRAAWDDFKLGLRHGNHFAKVAIVGHHRWQGLAAKIGSWFMSGTAESFEDEQAALDWLRD